MNETDDRYASFAAKYEQGDVPWDDPQPPPEVLNLVDRLAPGRALDLGSGYGRAGIFLGQHGWQVDGVEYVPTAVAESNTRAVAAGVAERVSFHVGDVSRLDFLTGPYDLALDVGCMHSLQQPALIDYRDGLRRLLPEGAIFLLFAHLRDETSSDEDSQRWIAETSLRALFATGFHLEEAVLGTTQVADKPPWSSGWFRFRRQSDDGS